MRITSLQHQYLTCKREVGDRVPLRELASPHRNLASPIDIAASFLTRFQRSLLRVSVRMIRQKRGRQYH